MSTTFRADRAGEAVRMAVSNLLRGEISDPRLENVTITACEVSRDLGFAKVFYTVLGDEEAREAAQAGFESAKPFMRSRVGEEVPLRVVPELSFRYDQSNDNALRLEELLSSLPELQNSEGEVKAKASTPLPSTNAPLARKKRAKR
jgi:ribosome-binding factor A